MRAVAPIVVAVLVLSCERDAPCSDPPSAPAAPRAGRRALVPAVGTQPQTAVGTSVHVAYAEPKNPAHRTLYEEVKRRHVLEQFAQAVSDIPLPKQLLLEFRGCDGDSNAYYDDVTTTITFCYEYLAEIRDTAAHHLVDGKYVQFPRSNERISLDDAMDGPACFVLFHEMGHAVYDLLKVPVLGRQEDAADFFAAASLLRLGKDWAMRHLRGAAWAYAVGAMSMTPELSDFADTHSLDSQRYFNILCLAYGSDPNFFGPAMKDAQLPPERAGDCRWEYAQVRYALQQLVLPSNDEQRLDYVDSKHTADVGFTHSRVRR